MNQAERRVWLIKALLDERPDGRSIAVPVGANEQRDLLRALMNVRPPEALAVQVCPVGARLEGGEQLPAGRGEEVGEGGRHPDMVARRSA